MHCYIYQIGTEPFAEGGTLNPENVYEGNGIFLSYTYGLDAEERDEAIENLVANVLPKGMFTLNADNNLIYNGGFKIWRKSYFDEIMFATKRLTPANVMDEYGEMQVLNGAITNPLNTASLFECGNGIVVRSIKLMRMIEKLDKGDILYVGSVLGYHN